MFSLPKVKKDFRKTILSSESVKKIITGIFLSSSLIVNPVVKAATLSEDKDRVMFLSPFIDNEKVDLARHSSHSSHSSSNSYTPSHSSHSSHSSSNSYTPSHSSHSSHSSSNSYTPSHSTTAPVSTPSSSNNSSSTAAPVSTPSKKLQCEGGNQNFKLNTTQLPAACGRDDINFTNLVVCVQMVLTQTGYYSGKLDGRLSSGTKEALKKFQCDNDLEINEYPDPETLKHLGIKKTSEKTYFYEVFK